MYSQSSIETDKLGNLLTALGTQYAHYAKQFDGGDKSAKLPLKKAISGMDVVSALVDGILKDEAVPRHSR